MFFNFIDELRAAGIPASFKEHLVLLEALDSDVIEQTPEEFYYLARATFVKDEGLLDRFDQVFAKVFKGMLTDYGQQPVEIPEDWLKAVAEKFLTPEEMEAIKALGSWDEIMETLKKRLEEQQKRHQGGNKWIGTGGTSPFGNSRLQSRRRADRRREQAQARDQGVGQARVQESRQHQGARHPQHQGRAAPPAPLRARRRGRRARHRRDDRRHRASRAGSTSTCGPSGTMRSSCCCSSTSAARWTRSSSCARSCSRAATAEFKNLEFFYFHNCLYEGVWKDNRRRFAERTPTWDVLHKYGHDYKLIFVGDAAMSPYEITHPGGSVEHFNEEAGAVWMQRLTNTYPAAVWLNPAPEEHWGYSPVDPDDPRADERPHVPADPRRARRRDARTEPEALILCKRFVNQFPSSSGCLAEAPPVPRQRAPYRRDARWKGSGGEFVQDDVLKLAYEVSRITEEKIGLIDGVMRQTGHARAERPARSGARRRGRHRLLGRRAGNGRGRPGNPPHRRRAPRRDRQQHRLARKRGRQMLFDFRGTRFTDLARNAVEIIDRNLYERSCDVRWWATDSAVVDALEEPERRSSPPMPPSGSPRSCAPIPSISISGSPTATAGSSPRGRPDLYPRAIGLDVSGSDWFRQAMATA